MFPSSKQTGPYNNDVLLAVMKLREKWKAFPGNVLGGRPVGKQASLEPVAKRPPLQVLFSLGGVGALLSLASGSGTSSTLWLPPSCSLFESLFN